MKSPNSELLAKITDNEETLLWKCLRAHQIRHEYIFARASSVHKHEIFVQDFPESLIANEHLNRAIHDAVGQNASGPPVLGLL